jgi:hypothetical protein
METGRAPLRGGDRGDDLATGNAPGGDVAEGLGELIVGVRERAADHEFLHRHRGQVDGNGIVGKPGDDESPGGWEQPDSERSAAGVPRCSRSPRPAARPRAARPGGPPPRPGPPPGRPQGHHGQEADRPAPSTQTGSAGVAPERLTARIATARGSISAPSSSLTSSGSRRSMSAGTTTDSAYAPGRRMPGPWSMPSRSHRFPDVQQDLAGTGDRPLDVHHAHVAVAGDRDGSHRLSSFPVPADEGPRDI